ncbi:MAG: hypothetical protein ACO4CZ_10390, partial [Planctomycetota bacterium]
ASATPPESEWTTTATRPVFVWPASVGVATMTVVDLDYSPPKMLWQGMVSGGKLEYPADAPALEVGFPYRVTVETPSGPIGRVFTIDPYLDLAKSAVGRVVPLR